MEPLKKGTILLEPPLGQKTAKNAEPLSYSTGNCEERNLCVYCTVYSVHVLYFVHIVHIFESVTTFLRTQKTYKLLKNQFLFDLSHILYKYEPLIV